jgi:hypothetical protein
MYLFDIGELLKTGLAPGGPEVNYINGVVVLLQVRLEMFKIINR